MCCGCVYVCAFAKCCCVSVIACVHEKLAKSNATVIIINNDDVSINL